MMSFCKNSLHAFLGISNRDIPCPPSTSPSPSPSPPGLNSIAADRRKPPNILESTSLKPPTTTVLKKDPSGSSTCSSGSGGGSGCLDEISSCGSLIHGLSSCTESLGFESSEQMEQNIINEDSIISKKSTISASSKSKQRSRFKQDYNKQFPPVLSSLRQQNDGNQHSTSMSFLKPVRENGRLLLTKVTINKPEVFHTSRQDGRLRLQLIHQNSKSEKPIQEKVVSLPSSSSSNTGAGEGFTRCHEMVNRHQERHRRRNNHNLQQQSLWNQQCVTSQ